MDKMEILNQAFNELLEKVFGGEIPEDYQLQKVHGVVFDLYRREVERKYGIYKDEEMYSSWITMLMLNSPLFYSEDDLK